MLLPQNSSRPFAPDPRRGMVLLAVLIVVVVLSLAAYQFSELMYAEYRSVDSYIRAAQAKAAAEAGIAYAAVLLSNTDAFTNTLASNPYDNESAFKGIIVSTNDNPRLQCRFSIVSPLDPDSDTNVVQPFRYGVIDESRKLNLNALMKIDSSGQVAQTALDALPNMTEDIVNPILDWIDSKSTTPRANGAKDEYYGGLTPPYRCKNGPLDSLDEMLLIKGMGIPLLYGYDKNRNGKLDDDEQDQSGTMDRGLAEYLTIYSRERNIDSNGNARVYINDSDLATLASNLSNAGMSDELVTYILAARTYGTTALTAGQTVTRSTTRPTRQTFTATTTNGGQTQLKPISSLYDLINSKVSMPVQGGRPGETQDLPSPLNDPSAQKELLPTLLDTVTTSQAAEVPARVNVNTAPQAVLAALPGLQDTDVQSILDKRPQLTSGTQIDPIYNTPAWLMTEASLPVATLKTLERYITTRSTVYRVQAIGYFDGGGPTARIEAVIDTNNGRPRIVYWRDLTELGKGFDIQSNP